MAPVVDARAEEQGPARPPAPPPKRRRSGSKAQQLAPGQATLDNFLLRPPEPQLPQPAEEAAEEGQGEEPQLQQAPEGQAAAGDSAGAGAMEKGRGTKRGRRSEAERLQPFSWDQ